MALLAAATLWLEAQVAPRGEVAWWKLDEAGAKALDASGRGLHGTVSGGAIVVQGRRGGALWLGGPESGVSGGGSILPAGDSPRTISAWIKPAEPRADPSVIFDYGKQFTLVLLPDGRVRFGDLTSAGRRPADSWSLITACYEGRASNRARIYIDGKLDAEGKANATPAAESPGKWSIGNSLAGGSVFRGAIDDVRVYARALTEAQAGALYRCSAERQDLPGFYDLPLFQGAAIEDRAADSSSGTVRNAGVDFGGIQFARPEGDCALERLRGADLGPDLRVSADLLVSAGAVAGPYFRARRAAPGDTVTGGYWVQLLSTGVVKVKRLTPAGVVAVSQGPTKFDQAVFHNLEIEARGPRLTASLDGRPVAFEQQGKRVDGVAIASVTVPNQGAAGIAFAPEDNRGQTGGQQARNIQITRISRQESRR